ncbi:MAG: tripartite tricarboxylate transporter substrate binding protein, partial [Burkholderiales bacterium]|nr:tripartite tricarboxylate transporter substrate binding protein [Burkholderiales bacterium]
MKWSGVILAVSCLVSAADCVAQPYPARSIRLVVPFAAGGATYIIAQALGQNMAARLGQNVVVDPRGGAGGVIGTDIVAKAAADGYTLLMATAANAANASLVKNMPHDFE